MCNKSWLYFNLVGILFLTKKFGLEKISSEFFRAKKMFDKYLFWAKKMDWKCFWAKKIGSDIFMGRNIFGVKRNLCRKFFGVETFLGQILFLDDLSVLLFSILCLLLT